MVSTPFKGKTWGQNYQRKIRKWKGAVLSMGNLDISTPTYKYFVHSVTFDPRPSYASKENTRVDRVMVLVVIHLLLRNSHALLEGNGILVVSSLNVLQELSALRGLLMISHDGSCFSIMFPLNGKREESHLIR